MCDVYVCAVRRVLRVLSVCRACRAPARGVRRRARGAAFRFSRILARHRVDSSRRVLRGRLCGVRGRFTSVCVVARVCAVCVCVSCCWGREREVRPPCQRSQETRVESDIDDSRERSDTVISVTESPGARGAVCILIFQPILCVAQSRSHNRSTLYKRYSIMMPFSIRDTSVRKISGNINVSRSRSGLPM